MHRNFEGRLHTVEYKKYRPEYPMEVFETIMDYCREGGTDNSLALDVGCGSGQSTTPLCSHFQHVIGIDISPAQIQLAPENNSKVTFRVGQAEDMAFLADKSVDLVTIATTLHWVDQEKFYKEAKRILKQLLYMGMLKDIFHPVLKLTSCIKR